MTTTVKRILIGLAIAVLLTVIFFWRKEITVWMTSNEYPEITAEENLRLNELRLNAYSYAVRCSNTTKPALKFEEITWVVIPQPKIVYTATDGRIRLDGYFSPNDSVIYTPYPRRDTWWILAHESLHAIGYIGHPDIPFRYPCQLMSEQNP